MSFYASLAISNNKNLEKLAFRYLIEGVIGSLLILSAILFLFLTTSSTNIDVIYQNSQILSNISPTLLTSCFLLFFIGIILKFFPLWLYHQKAKDSNDFITNYFSSSSFFFNSIIGLFILNKLVNSIFDNNFIFQTINFDIILKIIASAILLFSSYKIIKKTNLKLISFHFCLISIAQTLINISANNQIAKKALNFHILSYSLIGLLLFFLGSFLIKNIGNANIQNINLIKLRNKNLIAIIFFITIASISSLPPSLSFFAHFFTFKAYFINGNFNQLILLIPSLMAIVSLMIISCKIIINFYQKITIQQIRKYARNFSNKNNLNQVICLITISATLLFFTINSYLITYFLY